MVGMTGCITSDPAPGAAGPDGPTARTDAGSALQEGRDTTATPPGDIGGTTGPLSPSAQRLPGEALAGEPSIAVSPDGSLVIVVAPSRSAGANVVWRSLDAGATWEWVGPVAAHIGTNDATVAIDESGRIWIGTLWNVPPPGIDGLGNRCTAVSVSIDQGVTWRTNDDACGGQTYDERPWITAGPTGGHVLHPCAGSMNFCLSSSRDNEAWTNRPIPFAASVVSPPDTDGEELGFAFAPADPTRIPLAFRGPGVATSSDGGFQWDITLVADEPVSGRFLQYASSGGRAVVAWASLVDGAMRIRASIREAGEWSRPFDVSGGGANAMPWVDARDGRLLVAYLHADSDAHPHQVPDDATWFVETWVDGTVIRFPTPIHQGPLCSAYGLEPPCSGGRSRLGDFFSAALDRDGGVLVAVGVDADPDAVSFNAVPIFVLRAPAPEAPTLQSDSMTP